MTDERAIIQLGQKIGAGSSHDHGKSPFMTLDRLANTSERMASILKVFVYLFPPASYHKHYLTRWHGPSGLKLNFFNHLPVRASESKI